MFIYIMIYKDSKVSSKNDLWQQNIVDLHKVQTDRGKIKKNKWKRIKMLVSKLGEGYFWLFVTHQILQKRSTQNFMQPISLTFYQPCCKLWSDLYNIPTNILHKLTESKTLETKARKECMKTCKEKDDHR